MGEEFTPARWIARHGATVMASIPGMDALPAEAGVEVLSRRDGRMVLQLAAGGQAWVVKAFDPAAAESALAHQRERSVLRALAGTGLSPRLHAYSRAELWLLTDRIDGAPLVTWLDGRRRAQAARLLGRWLAAFAGQLEAQGRDEPADWDSYLAASGVAAPGFADFPISRRVIARNDAALGNFIVEAEGRLVGLDYEAAALKPLGWDVLLAARRLWRRFPAEGPALADALVEGWGVGTDTLTQDDFARLVRHFAANAAFGHGRRAA